jgi:DNA-binding NtrC family response regulator
MIAAGEFREDLYYRLNVVALTLPPLRDRGDDIELIGKFLLERFATEYSVGRKRFATDALIAMRKFSWPGNIRQLENHVKKSVILSERATIKASDLDLPGTGAQEILPLAEAKELWQSEYIRRVLEMNGGNRTKTARDLGVDPRTVFRFLEKEIDRTEP